MTGPRLVAVSRAACDRGREMGIQQHVTFESEVI